MKTLIKKTICIIFILVFCLSYLNTDAATMPYKATRTTLYNGESKIPNATKCSVNKKTYEPCEKIVIEWQPDKKAAYYTIELLNLTEKKYVVLNTKIYAPKCNYEIVELTPGCNYSVSVKAFNSGNVQGEKGNTVKFTVNPIKVKSIKINAPKVIYVGQTVKLTADVQTNIKSYCRKTIDVEWKVLNHKSHNVTINKYTGTITLNPSATIGDSVIVVAYAKGYYSKLEIKVLKSYIIPKHTYFSQINYPELSKTGCYITSSSMILSNLGFKADPILTYKANGNTTYLYRDRVLNYYNRNYSKQLGHQVIVEKNNSEKIEGKSDDYKLLRIVQYLIEKDKDHGGVFVQFNDGKRTHAMVAIGYQINSSGEIEILYDDPGWIKRSGVKIENTSFKTKDITYITVYSKNPIR